LVKFGSGTLSVLNQCDIADDCRNRRDYANLIFAFFRPSRKAAARDRMPRIADWRAGANWQLTRAGGLWPRPCENSEIEFADRNFISTSSI
jgi:hypothetical protein